MKMLRTFRIVIAVILILIVTYFAYELFRPIHTNDKLAKIIHLEDRREGSARLVSFLNDEEAEVRARAALAIGRIGAEDAGEILMGVVDDPDWKVAATAAFAISLTGEKDKAMPLLDFALEVPASITISAVRSAGILSDSTMTEEISMMLSYLDHASPEVREATLMALLRANAKSKATIIIEYLEKEPDEYVLQTGLYVLSRMGAVEAEDLFIDYLGDTDPYLRSLAVRGLNKAKIKDAEKFLNIALNDNNNFVVFHAINGISNLTSSNATKKLLSKLDFETDEQLIVALIDALRKLKEPSGVEIAKKIADREQSSNITAATVVYTATIQKGRAFNYIDSLMREDDPIIKNACTDALAEIADQSVVPRLGVLFKDKSAIVRGSAFTNLTVLDSNNTEFYIDQALNDTDFIPVILAIDVISEKKLSKYLPALQTMMSRGYAIDSDVRRSIIGAVGTFIENSETDPVLLDIIKLGLKDPEYIVRKDANDIQANLPEVEHQPVSLIAETKFSERQIRTALKKYKKNPYAKIITLKGEFEIELYFDTAPLTVMNFIRLSEMGYYNNLLFHRVIPDFVAQGGDPRGDGWGGPGYSIRCEYSNEPYKRGTVGIATSGKDTGGSQFFVTLSPQPHLESRYTIFGQVLYGMDIVDKLVVGDKIDKIEIQEGSE